MIYWATSTIDSSFMPYYDFMNSGVARWTVEGIRQKMGWAERFFNVQRWTEMPRGGHFAAMEEPELMADDLRAFFRPTRSGLESPPHSGEQTRHLTGSLQS
jgi:hypothetical protein